MRDYLFIGIALHEQQTGRRDVRRSGVRSDCGEIVYFRYWRRSICDELTLANLVVATRGTRCVSKGTGGQTSPHSRKGRFDVELKRGSACISAPRYECSVVACYVCVRRVCVFMVSVRE